MKMLNLPGKYITKIVMAKYATINGEKSIIVYPNTFLVFEYHLSQANT